MQEPKIKNITLPNQQPVCRVGIVTLEDDFRDLGFSLDQPSSVQLADSKSIELQAQQEYRVLIVADSIKLCDQDGKPVLENVSSLKIKVGYFEAKSGLKLKKIRTGRDFHWQKFVDLTFAGEIEFINFNQKLLVVNHISLEQYIACVVTSEMGASCPAEMIKAQAVTARSWALVFLGHKHQDLPYTICNDDCCQRYQGTTFANASTLQAALATNGEFLVEKSGFVCPAYYSKSCGGKSETTANAFGLETHSYLPKFDSKEFFDLDLTNDLELLKFYNDQNAKIFCSDIFHQPAKLAQYLGAVDNHGKYYRWEYKVSNQDLAKNINQKLNLKIERINQIKVLKRGVSGRALSLEINYDQQQKLEILSQYEIRRVLHPTFMYSSAFIVEQVANDFVFKGLGWGHGAGLCQIGALGMALSGSNYKQILAHYFDQSSLNKAYA